MCCMCMYSWHVVKCGSERGVQADFKVSTFSSHFGALLVFVNSLFVTSLLSRVLLNRKKSAVFLLFEHIGPAVYYILT